MKDLLYYLTPARPAPKRSSYTKVYVYRAGKCVFEGLEDDYNAVRQQYRVGYTVERSLDLASFRAHRDLYEAERVNLLEEFRDTLFIDNNVFGHPKAQAAYALAWDYGHAAGLQEVINYFEDLVELIK